MVPASATPELFGIAPQSREGINDPTLAGSDASLVVALMVVVSVCCSLRGIVDLDLVAVDYLDAQVSAGGVVVCVGQRRALGGRVDVEPLLGLPHELSRSIELPRYSARSVDEEPCDREA